MARRSKVKRHGVAPRFDHSKIRTWFGEGKDISEIVKLTGYSRGYVLELHWKYSKKWY